MKLKAIFGGLLVAGMCAGNVEAVLVTTVDHQESGINDFLVIKSQDNEGVRLQVELWHYNGSTVSIYIDDTLAVYDTNPNARFGAFLLSGYLSELALTPFASFFTEGTHTVSASISGSDVQFTSSYTIGAWDANTASAIPPWVFPMPDGGSSAAMLALGLGALAMWRKRH